MLLKINQEAFSLTIETTAAKAKPVSQIIEHASGINTLGGLELFVKQYNVIEYCFKDIEGYDEVCHSPMDIAQRAMKGVNIPDMSNLTDILKGFGK